MGELLMGYEVMKLNGENDVTIGTIKEEKELPYNSGRKSINLIFLSFVSLYRSYR